MWGSSSTTSTDVWAGPPSWDPIVLGEDEEDDDSGGYAYGDIKWGHSRLDMAKSTPRLLILVVDHCQDCTFAFLYQR